MGDVTQRARLEQLLRQAGSRGVDAHDLVYREGITRAAAIVLDLRDAGWVIDTRQDPALGDGRQRLATYVLRQEPGKPPVARQGAVNGPGRPEQRVVASTSTLPPATDLRLPCGCVRAADGRRWLARCQRHERAADRAAQDAPRLHAK